MKIKSFEENQFSDGFLAERGLFFQFLKNKKMFVHNQEKIKLFTSLFPKSCRLTVMLYFDNIFFENKSRFEKSLHDFKC